MELENLNLEELNVQEVENIEGGYWPQIGWYMDVGFSCSFGYGGSREIWM